MWTIEYESDSFARFVDALPPYEQAVLLAAIENILTQYGPDICSNEWGKPLKGGLYEFRIRKSLKAILGAAGIDVSNLAPGNDKPVLLRVFCAFYGNKIVILHHGYNKKADASEKRQRREIQKARKLHDRWARQHRS